MNKIMVVLLILALLAWSMMLTGILLSYPTDEIQEVFYKTIQGWESNQPKLFWIAGKILCANPFENAPCYPP